MTGLALAIGTVATSAPPAGAASAQSCAKVTGTLTMKPGLSTAARDQTVTIKGTESACNPAGPSGGTGAFSSVLMLKNASCSTFIQGGMAFTGNAKTTWKNQRKTTYSITYKNGSGAKVVSITMTGKATAGLFKGKKFTGGIKINATNAKACAGANFKTAKFTQLKAWTIS